MPQVLPWIVFSALVIGVLALDLGVFHRQQHVVSIREATRWTAVWVSLALAFNAGIWWLSGPVPALEFLTGYVIEYSLSVDNIFVFVLIFTMFRVPAKSQYRVLFWGILGAFAMRGVMIGIGAALIHRFHAIIYVFGVFLVYTGVRIALKKGEDAIHVGDNPLVALVRRRFPMTAEYRGDRFWVREDGGRLVLTPLVLVLIVIETSDLIFAVDSIPAIFAVTDDAFIVYTSNVFAILGLRSLYFLLAGIIDRFHYLKPALAVILTFVGVKMVVSDLFVIPVTASLGVIAAVLLVAILASIARARRLGPIADELPDPRIIPEGAAVPGELVGEQRGTGGGL